MLVEAVNTAGAKAGDRVVISFKTASLIKASFLIYIFPIICLIIGALIGKDFKPLLNHMNESSASAIMGFMFLTISFVCIRLAGNQMAKKSTYRPQIIKIISRPPISSGADAINASGEKTAIIHPRSFNGIVTK
jgi:sigma-E factor negative regulatory protein RseC